MPKHTPESFIKEENQGQGGGAPDQVHWISEAGGLTQFGSYLEILQPGSCSSIKHWHSAEDEMVYVLAGQVTLVEGDTETLLHPGDAATFRAGVAVGHCLWNRSALPTTCLVVGTRAQVDRITYPEHDRVCLRDRSLEHDAWVDTAGRPATSPY
ncbi:cupin domain-containing protein [Massilia soli]|uniref:Cupin domain-containing protein n=1 Tax=Massilia soli TaxID=2792854 RepID=A0ABS7SR12_9BURK|nr:cupin domain-containing protein [Massilia soli]MBZ2208380.1 cupin domain-containing protein [Massilia soli]